VNSGVQDLKCSDLTRTSSLISRNDIPQKEKSYQEDFFFLKKKEKKKGRKKEKKDFFFATL